MRPPEVPLDVLSRRLESEGAQWVRNKPEASLTVAPLTDSVTVRVTAEELAALDRAVGSSGLNRSSVVRWLIRHYLVVTPERPEPQATLAIPIHSQSGVTRVVVSPTGEVVLELADHQRRRWLGIPAKARLRPHKSYGVRNASAKR